MGVERAARWPGAHRTSFWGAGGGSDADRPPLGGSPFHVAAAPSAPGLLVSRGLEPPSLALALQAVGGLLLPPVRALPLCPEGDLRGQNRPPTQPPLAQMRSWCSGLRLPPGRPSPAPGVPSAQPGGWSPSPHAHRLLGSQANAAVCAGQGPDPRGPVGGPLPSQ